jgi:alpha-glucosidase
MKRIFFCLLFAVIVSAPAFCNQAAAANTNAATATLHSPDGQYCFTFSQHDGRLWYSITYRNQPIVLSSELGVNLDNRLFESALAVPNEQDSVWVSSLIFRGIDSLSIDTTWHPVYGERTAIRDHYRQFTFHFSKGAPKKEITDGYDQNRQYFFDIQVRAYNEGIAFRYHFPETTNGLFLNITGERTQFTMPAGTQSWYEEWAQGPYHYLPLRDWKAESERPLLLHLPNGMHVALMEAQLTDYARGKFRLAAPDVLQVSLYHGVEVMSPYNTPWRLVMAADRAVDLINHKDLVLNLNAPQAADINPQLQLTHAPGKAYRCGKLERSYIMEGIRFAEQQHLQYIELDAGWYGPEMKMSSSALAVSSARNFNIPEICDSAHAHGLGVWLYVNQRALYQQLDSILPLYKRWGVSGIKFGFVQVGNQQWTTWLHQAIRKCAQAGLLLDIHDEYRPTGYSRTYPNLLSQEGIMGNECMPDADHNVTLPFTRYLCGPADYTLCYYNKRVRATHAHQLAMAAVYYSPIQFMYWYDDPKVYDGGEELQFWRDIPTVFDESKAIDGEPGQYIVQARRTGKDWFVGVMNGTVGRTVTIRTSEFLPKGKYQVILYTDDPKLETRSQVATTRRIVKSGDKLSLPLLPSGGAALHFSIIK